MAGKWSGRDRIEMRKSGSERVRRKVVEIRRSWKEKKGAVGKGREREEKKRSGRVRRGALPFYFKRTNMQCF